MDDDSAAQHTTMQALHRKFITGCHILHLHGVLDAYGHLSARHPFRPDVFIMSRSMAPGTVSSPDDLIEYWVENAEPVATSAAKGFAERHIHSEIYRQHPGVHAAVHSHAEAVVPYTIVDVPLRPCYHMAGFLGLGGGLGPPVWDAADFVAEDDVHDMLVRDKGLGSRLAQCFDDGSAVALMRGHGFTAVAGRVEEAVLRAVYTQKNAAIQTAALAIHGAHAGGDGGGTAAPRPARYLNGREAVDCTEMTRWSAERPWRLWAREVEACGLYVNSA